MLVYFNPIPHNSVEKGGKGIIFAKPAYKFNNAMKYNILTLLVKMEYLTPISPRPKGSRTAVKNNTKLVIFTILMTRRQIPVTRNPFEK